MNAFSWMEQQLSAMPATRHIARPKPVLKRELHAQQIADEIERRGCPMTRTELMAHMNLSRSSVRKACEAGEASGLLKQIPDRRPEAGLLTFLIDLA